jgi:phosphohistidine phosphatase
VSGAPSAARGAIRLTLLRHGHAAAEVGGDDRGRPLDARGRAEVAARAPLLLAAAGRPGLCLASDALRTRQTAALLCGAGGYEGLAPLADAALYLAGPEEILASVAAHRQATGAAIEHVLVVGHNPGLSELGTRLRAAAGQHPAAVGLGTGEFVSVALAPDAWRALAG